MDKWFILYKFFIFLYCAFLFIVRQNNSNEVAIIIVILIYICLNTLQCIFKSVKIKKCLSSLSCILLIASYKYVGLFFVFLLPANISELIIYYFQEILVNVIILVSFSFLIDKNIVPEYILISLVTVLFYYLVTAYYNKISQLISERDELREKVFQLNTNLIKDVQRENQVKYLSQLEERNKIAQEIHDSIGHTISASLMQLEAGKLLITKDSEKAGYIIQNTIDVLREGMEKIRATLRNIKPPTEQIGINRIKLLTDRVMTVSHIETKLIYKGNLDNISFFQWKVITNNINEALTNAIKYSKATSITVNIEVLNKFIKTEIKDNGIGNLKIKKGLGLKGIEERSEGIGGKVIVDGSDGFSVIILLPI